MSNPAQIPDAKRESLVLDVVALAIEPMGLFFELLDGLDGHECDSGRVGRIGAALMDHAQKRLFDLEDVLQKDIGRIYVGYKHDGSTAPDGFVGARVMPTKRAGVTSGEVAEEVLKRISERHPEVVAEIMSEMMLPQGEDREGVADHA